mmetsp:Transcript_27752/g.70790  ORF Transcript_27752/g.70790 Transcript_27752/m.70790 type:complete len:115 (-) Transcript_27752:959-1303(-)
MKRARPVAALLLLLFAAHPASSRRFSALSVSNDDRSADNSVIVLCATTKRRRSSKPTTLHDIAPEDAKNEYSTDVGGNSQTVLIDPSMDDANATQSVPEPEPPASRMKGAGRKL